MNDREITEAIDACRPGADDASLPEVSGLADILRDNERVRQLYERTQRSDAAIGHAFRSPPVPEGISVRLLEAVRKQAAELPQDPSSFIDEAIHEKTSPNEGGAVSIAPKRSVRWRYVVGGGVSLVAAIALVCFLFGGLGNGDVLLVEELPGEVEQWVNEAAPSTGWSEDLAEAAHPYPRHAAINAFPHRWRVARTRYDSQASLYDVTPGRPKRFAYVFCIRTRTTSALPSSPPRVPDSETGGVAIGAWQRDGMVYVLVVKGGRKRYQDFIDSGYGIG